MVSFLGCLDANGSDESKCLKAKEALQVCVEAAATTANKWRHKAPINFHLKQVRRSRPLAAWHPASLPGIARSS